MMMMNKFEDKHNYHSNANTSFIRFLTDSRHASVNLLHRAVCILESIGETENWRSSISNFVLNAMAIWTPHKCIEGGAMTVNSEQM